MRLRKKLFFTLLAMLGVSLVLEIGTRCMFYQKASGTSLALVRLYRAFKNMKQRAEIKAAFERFESVRPEDPIDDERDFFENPEKAALREEYCLRYATIFDSFIELCRAGDAIPVVMYVPGGYPKMKEFARSYFAYLAKTRGLPFLDLTDELAKYPPDQTSLMPQDGHLSRFGNQLVAKELHRFLQPVLRHRANASFETRPSLLGDLQPSRDEIFAKETLLPFHLVTNAQGLRRNQDLTFPKSEKPRILCVGDSYTFGHGVHQEHCYPQLMEAEWPDLEVVNAGVCGYTICDQLSYFEDRGRFTEPDIVVLQTFPNDLYGFSPYLLKTFCRGGSYCPTKGER